MKAKFIVVKDKFEMHLENKNVIKSAIGETKKMFLKRCKEETELDGDLEITQLTAEAFAETPIEKLKLAASKGQGLLKVIMEEALAKRGEVSKEDAAAAKAAEVAAKLAEKEAAKAAKLAEKEAAKAAKVLAPKPTLDEVLAAATEAKANVGHTVKFTPHGFGTKETGVINGVWVDKRVPMALYRIFDADGKMYNKVLSASDLEIGELAPNPKAEAKAAEKLAKEEAKAAEKLAKEEAAKAKAEAAAKAAAEKLAAKEEAAKAKAEAAEAKAAEKLAAHEAKVKALAEGREAAEKTKAAEIAAKDAKK